jgi:hypothetical protein
MKFSDWSIAASSVGDGCLTPVVATKAFEKG